MGKAHNRNKSKKQNGRPMNVMSGGKGKGFIGSNVFTMDDEAIIDKIIQDPNWCINDIKEQLPYSHSIKNIINFLQTKLSPEEINNHATAPSVAPTSPNETQSPTAPKQPDPTRNRWSKEETEIVTTYYPILGPHGQRWSDLLPHRTKSAIKQHAIMNKASYLTKNDNHPFTKDDDELLLSDYQSLGFDAYEWAPFLSHPHTTAQIKMHVEELLQSQKPEVKITSAPQKQEVHTVNENKTITNEQLFDKLRELANTEGIDVTVNINFGDGLMFVLDTKGGK